MNTGSFSMQKIDFFPLGEHLIWLGFQLSRLPFSLLFEKDLIPQLHLSILLMIGKQQRTCPLVAGCSLMRVT